MQRWSIRDATPPGWAPTQIAEVHLEDPLPALPPSGDAPPGRGCARVFVRLHTRPVGSLDVVLGASGLDPARLAKVIDAILGDLIRAHLACDGLTPPDRLSAAGLPAAGGVACLRRRTAVMAHPPLISVVVATRDRPESLDACLAALAALAYPSFEIVVVDSAPSSSAAAHLIESRWSRSTPAVSYLHEQLPGLAVAHNRGIAAARGEIVAFTDDDVVVDRHWLAALAEAFGSDPAIGCVTGLILPAELETPEQCWVEQSAGFGKGFELQVFSPGGDRSADPLFPYAAGRFGSGANMAFRSSLLHDLGGFDPALGAGTPARGGDDLAAFASTLLAGHSLVYQPGAIVWHRHRRDWAGLYRQAYGYGIGLGAYLTSILLSRPRLVTDMLGRAPAGVRYALSPRSPKNHRKPADYPRRLTTAEQRGMLVGPLAYLHARWRSVRPGRRPAVDVSTLRQGHP